MNKLGRWIHQHAIGIVLFGIVSGAIGAYYSVQLYLNLRTEIYELLPSNARSVLDLDEVTQRLESIDNLVVLIFSDHFKESEKFVVDLAAELQKEPKTTIASIEYKIDKELQFFKERQALYIDLKDLVEIRNFVREKIAYEKELHNPLTIFGNRDFPEPEIDLIALRQKYEGRTSTFESMPGGFYATSDGKIRALIANLPGKGIAAQMRLKKAVTDAIERLNPKSYAPDLEIKLSGGVEDALEEQEALVEDLEVATVIVTLVVVAGMLWFFRSIRATIALMTSLFIGTFWTFGISYFLVGYLNANSAFLGSIVIGNGINFGIIFLARYLEERRKKEGVISATSTSILETYRATVTAALAAGLSYGSLMLTGFRGFKQFGVIGLVGMLLCWISAFTILPALLVLMDKKRSLVRRAQPKPIITEAIARTLSRFSRPVFYVSIFLTLFSLLKIAQIDKSFLETDLNKLRNIDSMEHGSGYLSKYMDEIFQRYLTPIAILADSAQNAGEIDTRLEAVRNQNKDSSIGTVQTLRDFVPADQERKIQILTDIKRSLPPRLLARLPLEEQKRIDFLLNPKVMTPITQKDLPPLILEKFTEKDGSVGKMVLVEPPLDHQLQDGDKLIAFIDLLRKTADEVKPGAPVAGQLPISSDMIRAISSDGPKATLWAFIAVLTLVIILFRNVKQISLVMGSLLVGIVWLAGFALSFDLKVNFLNFIALPITFGIGVDYGVNIFQRYHLSHGNTGILSTIRSTGSAVGLCSFSTIVGYFSLVIARNQGFVSFGWMAVIGEITCLIAAMVSIPAYLVMRDRGIPLLPWKKIRKN